MQTIQKIKIDQDDPNKDLHELMNEDKEYWDFKKITLLNKQLKNEIIHINGNINIKDDSNRSLLQFCFYNDLDFLSSHILNLKK